ncbi:50S ribosomal protein L37ae [Nanoarchaeota archaeon]
MAKKSEKLGTARRFGARYGPRSKHKLAQIEKLRGKGQVCIFCKKPKVKRLSLGIWHCQKCDKKFTSRAYSVKERSFKAEVK